MRLVNGAAKTAAPSPETASAFETFWRACPRRVGKLDALRAYQQALKLATAAEIQAGAERWALESQDQEPRYIKHPATWLRAGCWMDEPMTTTGATSRSSTECPHDPICLAPGRWACLQKQQLDAYKAAQKDKP